MTHLAVAAAVVCTCAAVAPYAVQAIRGAARPQVVTWAVWAVITAIGAAAALTSGQLPAAVFGLACTAECALIAVLGLRIPASERDPPVTVRLPAARIRLDLICLAGAVAALVLLAVVRATAAVAATVAADFLAFIPTVGQAWRKPRDEPWSTWALYAAGGALTLLAADWHQFTAVAYPLYLTAGDTTLVCLILARRAAVRPRSRVPPPSGARRWRDGGTKPASAHGEFPATATPAAPGTGGRSAAA